MFRYHLPNTCENHFGGTLLSLIIRNKLFFFAETEAAALCRAAPRFLRANLAPAPANFPSCLNPSLKRSLAFQSGLYQRRSAGGPGGLPRPLSCKGQNNVLLRQQSQRRGRRFSICTRRPMPTTAPSKQLRRQSQHHQQHLPVGYARGLGPQLREHGLRPLSATPISTSTRLHRSAPYSTATTATGMTPTSARFAGSETHSFSPTLI